MGSEPEPTIRTTKDRPATTQQLEPQSLPPQLGKTLEQIVGQLDVLTQVLNCYCTCNSCKCNSLTLLKTFDTKQQEILCILNHIL